YCDNAHTLRNSLTAEKYLGALVRLMKKNSDREKDSKIVAMATQATGNTLQVFKECDSPYFDPLLKLVKTRTKL
ncbi:hypothetical protein SARC_16187, partial [Sphaeroforma arctica JP610]